MVQSLHDTVTCSISTMNHDKFKPSHIQLCPLQSSLTSKYLMAIRRLSYPHLTSAPERSRCSTFCEGERLWVMWVAGYTICCLNMLILGSSLGVDPHYESIGSPLGSPGRRSKARTAGLKLPPSAASARRKGPASAQYLEQSPGKLPWWMGQHRSTPNHINLQLLYG